MTSFPDRRFPVVNVLSTPQVTLAEKMIRKMAIRCNIDKMQVFSSSNAFLVQLKSCPDAASLTCCFILTPPVIIKNSNSESIQKKSRENREIIN